jgi:hypothetical protein
MTGSGEIFENFSAALYRGGCCRHHKKYWWFENCYKKQHRLLRGRTITALPFCFNIMT